MHITKVLEKTVVIYDMLSVATKKEDGGIAEVTLKRLIQTSNRFYELKYKLLDEAYSAEKNRETPDLLDILTRICTERREIYALISKINNLLEPLTFPEEKEKGVGSIKVLERIIAERKTCDHEELIRVCTANLLSVAKYAAANGDEAVIMLQRAAIAYANAKADKADK